jgi:hypothetical protein
MNFAKNYVSVGLYGTDFGEHYGDFVKDNMDFTLYGMDFVKDNMDFAKVNCYLSVFYAKGGRNYRN